MKREIRTLTAASFMLVYLFVWSAPSKAQEAATLSGSSSPRTLSYQGVISKAGTPGNYAAGPHVFKVTLYGDANGTIKLWQTTMNIPVDSSGVFNCTLGNTANPLPEPSALDRPIWLGVAVDNGPELRPLSEVTASAYALNVVDNAITTNKLADGAVTTAKLADNAVSTSKIADSSITASKVNFSYVPSITVNGLSSDRKGAPLNIESGNGIELAWLNDSNTVVISGTTSNAKGDFVGGNPTFTNSDDGNPGSGSHAGSTNTVGGGTTNTAYGGTLGDLAGHATIAGGQGNTAEDTFATIGGGDTNTASGYESTISGGTFNNVTNRDGFIGGGLHNINKSRYAAMAGGDANIVDTQTDASFLGGGLANRIGYFGHSQVVGDTTYIGANVLSGGRNNLVKSIQAALVGGNTNTIDTFADEAFLGAGSNNIVTEKGTEQGVNAAIVAGAQNYVRSASGFIGAGASDSVFQQDGGIVAGKGNIDSSAYGIIGGGEFNTINGRNPYTNDGGQSFIGAGFQNSISASGSFVGTGEDDTILTFGASAVSGQYAKISSASDYAFIGAGSYNLIDTGSANSSITGGDTNTINLNSPHSAIDGGTRNQLFGSSAFIGGGNTNRITANTFGDPSPYSMIGGGRGNLVSDSLGVLVGGDSNTVEAPWAFLGGGAHNISGDRTTFGLEDSFVVEVGGDSNWSREEYSAIVGGKQNESMGTYGFIGGGFHNLIDDEDVLFTQFSTIGGGFRNTERSEYNAITGGDSNFVQTGSNYAFIGGGLSNLIDTSSPWSAISGGQNNHIAAFSDHDVIGGGKVNTIADSSIYTVIAGGDNNVISNAGGPNPSSEFGSFIGAGRDNLIDANGVNAGTDSTVASAIVAGTQNIASERSSFVGAGDANVAGDDEDFVGAGVDNIAGEGTQSAIVGGLHNNIAILGAAGSGGAFIGSGNQNSIEAEGVFAAIPAGENLRAEAYSQTVMGFNNVANAGATNAASALGAHKDDFVMIVGDGADNSHRADAFEISNNGHSIVHDVNGNTSAPGRTPFYGGTYQDNVVSAWGDVDGTGFVRADFGVQKVVHAGAGTYVVFLSLQDNSGNAVNLTGSSVTVTIRHNDTTNVNRVVILTPTDTLDNTCGHADATEIGIFNIPNTFVVHTYPTGSCDPEDIPFFFKVCGRPTSN